MLVHALQGRTEWSKFVGRTRAVRDSFPTPDWPRCLANIIPPTRRPNRSSPPMPAWRGVLSLVAVLLFPALPATAATDTNAKSDCLFNWVESLLPDYLLPRGTLSATSGPYYLRYYSVSNAFLGVSSDTGHVYYFGPLTDNSILDLGDAATWYATSGCNTSNVQQAKDMFAELRTTLNSFANDGKTGFLDDQSRTINNDADANVGPGMNRVARRFDELNVAMEMFEDARTYSSSNTHGLALDVVPFTLTTALVRQNGNLKDVWNGYNTSFDYCWTDSTTGVMSKITCAHARSDSPDWIGRWINMDVYELTAGSAAHEFNYVATRYRMPVTGSGRNVTFNALTREQNALLSTAITPVYLPTGTGTVAKTFAGDQVTSIILNGTMPPTGFACAAPTATSLPGFSSKCPAGQIVIPGTGVDTVALSAVRTPLAAANTYHYALSGSVSAVNASDSTKVVSLSFDNGSYIDMEETTSTNAKNHILAAQLTGTASSSATTLTGTVTTSAFMYSADGDAYIPTSVVFEGSIRNTPTGSTAPLTLLTGRVVTSVADYNKYYSRGIPASGAVAGATNYVKATVTFTGTVQAPSRPQLQLELSATQTGHKTGATSLRYTYDNVIISGSGAFDDNVNSNGLTLVNQDGIQIVVSRSGDHYVGTVTKSGTTLATISNKAINYADGYSESLW